MSVQTGDSTRVSHSVDIAAAPERAFAVFTEGIDQWWPREHHVQTGTLKEIGVEGRVGGRMWTENDAGEQCGWGRVLTWDPPRAFAFAWLIGADFSLPVPGAPASRVTVSFTPTSAGTRVELVHDQLDVYGEGWRAFRDAVGGEMGWQMHLRLFAAAF
jgi:uncharacterized protein YndB with AHSA1/START domain